MSGVVGGRARPDTVLATASAAGFFAVVRKPPVEVTSRGRPGLHSVLSSATRTLWMTIRYARVANHTVAAEYDPVSAKAEGLYAQPAALAPDAEGQTMPSPGRPPHARQRASTLLSAGVSRALVAERLGHDIRT